MKAPVIPKEITIQSLIAHDWLIDLDRLLTRHDGLCCLADIPNYTIDELKGLYNWLSSLD